MLRSIPFVFLACAAIAETPDVYRRNFCGVASNAAGHIQYLRQRQHEAYQNVTRQQFVLSGMNTRSREFWDKEIDKKAPHIWDAFRPLTKTEFEAILDIVFSFGIGEGLSEQLQIKEKTISQTNKSCLRHEF